MEKEKSTYKVLMRKWQDQIGGERVLVFLKEMLKENAYIKVLCAVGMHSVWQS